MLLTSEILILGDKAVKRSQRLGLMPFKSKLVTKHLIVIHKTKKFFYLNRLNRFLTFVTLIVICCIEYISIPLQEQGLVPISFIALLAFVVLALLLCISLDICIWFYDSECCSALNTALLAAELADGKLSVREFFKRSHQLRLIITSRICSYLITTRT